MKTLKQRTARLAVVVLAVLGALVASAQTAGASTSSRPQSGKQMHWYHAQPPSAPRAERFGSTAIVGLESMADLASLRASYGLERVHAIPSLHAAQVRVDDRQLRSLLGAAASDPRIRYVSPAGHARRPLGMPNDPLLRTVDAMTSRPYEWQFASSHVDRALDISPGDSKIVVGVIDTGAAAVPDLAGKVDSLWRLAPDGTAVEESVQVGDDEMGHGTAVASLIAANVDDGFGMAGFGGATHVIAVRADIQGFFNDTRVAMALTKLDSLGVRIVNMSLGGPYPSEPILVDAIHKAAADGILLVAATGNSHEHVAWPAADLQAPGGGRSYGLAVGASDVDGRLTEFSNSGKALSLVAPGSSSGTCSAGVLVALPPASAWDEVPCFSNWWGAAGGAHYGYIRGTSFSSPEVAGIAALVWAARPELTNYQVADIIKASARRDTATGWTPDMGCGVLDAGAALELATSRTQIGAAPGPCSTAGDELPVWPSETQARQTITFGALPDRKLGDPDFRVNATASSGLQVSLAPSGPCTVNGHWVHITGVGVCTLIASQEGDDNYSRALPVTQTLSIAKGQRPKASKPHKQAKAKQARAKRPPRGSARKN